MTDQAKYKIRRLLGWAAMFGAIAITALTGYRAHRSTQQQAEQFRQRQNILAAVAGGETSAVAMLDNDGKVVLWNDAMAELTGFTQEEIEKGGLRLLMCSADEEAKHADGLAQAFRFPGQHRKLTIVNCRIQTKEGKTIPVRIAIRLLRSFDGENFASAHVDPQSQVVEFGSPPPDVKHIPAK